MLCAAEDFRPDHLEKLKEFAVEAFEANPQSGKVFQNIASHIRTLCDKEFGRGWNCVVGANFGAFVTQKMKCYCYFSVYPRVSILVWKC